MKKPTKPKSILYYPVATIATRSLGEAFLLTQGIESLEKEQVAKVLWEVSPLVRSSMVGDIVENKMGVYILKPHGWSKLR